MNLMIDPKFQPFVPNVTFELIPINQLVSSQKYQRSLSETHILRAADNFDLRQINPVKVSRRDGINYVVNGQHTIEIVALVSNSRETPVWCMVFDELSYETEAHIFAEQQKYVKSLVPFETFTAHIESGNEKHLAIRDVVKSYGLEVGAKKTPGCICAVSSLEYIYDKYGMNVLDQTLRMCVGTWEGEDNSFSANILKAIAKMIVTYGDQLREDVFKEKVGQLTVKALTRQAKDRGSGSIGFAEVMVLTYNRKCKYRLSMQKLYGSRKHSSNIAYEEEEMDNEAEE